MAQPLRATCTESAGPLTAPRRPSGLMVMALRAAEQPVLVVLGEADVHTAGQLRTELIDRLPGETSVLVELGALEFCDLPGLDALHDAARAAHDAGVALTFRGMSAQLSWLHHAFPPCIPTPPPSTPGKAQSVPDTSAAASASTPTTAPTLGHSSGPNVSPHQTRATPRTSASTFPVRPGCTSAAPGPARSADLTDGGRFAGARRSTKRAE